MYYLYLDTFLASDTSIINGLYDYYLQSNSLKCIDMFIVMKEPQEQCLFERYIDFFICYDQYIT